MNRGKLCDDVLWHIASFLQPTDYLAIRDACPNLFSNYSFHVVVENDIYALLAVISLCITNSYIYYLPVWPGASHTITHLYFTHTNIKAVQLEIFKNLKVLHLKDCYTFDGNVPRVTDELSVYDTEVYNIFDSGAKRLLIESCFLTDFDCDADFLQICNEEIKTVSRVRELHLYNIYQEFLCVQAMNIYIQYSRLECVANIHANSFICTAEVKLMENCDFDRCAFSTRTVIKNCTINTLLVADYTVLYNVKVKTLVGKKIKIINEV